MKQPTRTLSQALKLFPESWKQVIENTIPDNFYKLPYEEKIKHVGYYKRVYCLSFKNNKLFFGLKTITICRTGKTFYPKYSWVNTIVIENNKIHVKNLTKSGLETFLSIIGLKIPLQNIYSLKPCVIADILRKKVYSEETFYRCVLSKIYHLKGFNWKLFSKYLVCDNRGISIFDLKDFTKDLTKSLEVLVNNSCNHLYTDLVSCAIKLNEVVDLTWSKKRMSAEHQRQINELNRRDIEAKEEIPIFDVCLDEPNIHMLNTEKEVFLEGLNMHHCLYRCYWDKIKRKEYVAFHMIYPQDCTFSFRTMHDHVTLDQAYLAYDQRVSEETRSSIMQFLERNRDSLYKLLTKEENPFEGIFDAEDLPY